MADTIITVKDATGVDHDLRYKDGGVAGDEAYHVDEEARAQLADVNVNLLDIETALTAINTQIATLNGQTDGLETALAAINTILGVQADTPEAYPAPETLSARLYYIMEWFRGFPELALFGAVSKLALRVSLPDGFYEGISALQTTTSSLTGVDFTTLAANIQTLLDYASGTNGAGRGGDFGLIVSLGPDDWAALQSLVALINGGLPSSLGRAGEAGALLVALSNEDFAKIDGLETLLAGGLPAALTGGGNLKTALQEAVPAGENHIGGVHGTSGVIVVNPTVSTSPAYSIGDTLGGKLSLANAVRVSGGTATWQSFQIIDRSNVKPTGRIYLFSADPSTATLTDNSAANFTTTDDYKICAKIRLTAAHWDTDSSTAIAVIPNIGQLVKAASGTTLYAVFVLDAAVTLATTTGIQMQFAFGQD